MAFPASSWEKYGHPWESKRRYKVEDRPRIRVIVTQEDVDESRQFTVLPDDRSYALELIELDPDQSEKGPYWMARLKVVDDDTYSGETMLDVFALPRGEMLQLGGAAKKKEMKRGFRLWDFLAAAGFKLGPQGFDEADLIGLRVRASVKTEEYQGVNRSRPQTYFPL